MKFRLSLVFLVICFVAVLIFTLWVDLAITRAASRVFYYLVFVPLMVVVASLVIKVLASSLFGWKISYAWLLVVTGFAFLAMQVLGQANYLVYSFVWRFTRLISLLAFAVNLAILSSLVAVVLKIASGRSWRQAFLVTFIGVFGLSVLMVFFSRATGLRAWGFWPLAGI